MSKLEGIRTTGAFVIGGVNQDHGMSESKLQLFLVRVFAFGTQVRSFQFQLLVIELGHLKQVIGPVFVG